jgi:shikimate kinase
MKSKVQSTVHGAISIVNAIATGYGSALGISLKVRAEIELQKGKGIIFRSHTGDRLITNIISNTVPKDIIQHNLVTINIESEIPIGVGLKSSSAVSSAIALACISLVKDKIDDRVVLDSAVRASLDAGITLTGAYDDSTACYFGGFVVTDNYGCKLISQEDAPEDLYAIIFLPQSLQRGDVHKLNILSDLFMDAFKLAKAREYWKAMKLNGLLATAILSGKYEPILASLQKGALAASISGNGPSIAAVAYREHIEAIKGTFERFDGKTLVSKINNEKASAKVIVG